MKLKAALIALTIATVSGCATQTFEINGGGTSTPATNKMQPFFVGGIGQEQTMNAAEVCGGVDKIAKVETQLTFLDGALGGISYGIFTPRQAKVYCTE